MPVQLYGVDAAVLSTEVVAAAPAGRPRRRRRGARRPADPQPPPTCSPSGRSIRSALAPIERGGRAGGRRARARPAVGVGRRRRSPSRRSSSRAASSADHLRARAMMYADPHAWAGLLNWCADVTGAFLRAQVVAGASAAQLCDPGDRLAVATRLPATGRPALAAGLRRRCAGSTSRASTSEPEAATCSTSSRDRRDGGRGRPARSRSTRRASGSGGAVPLQGNLDPALLVRAMADARRARRRRDRARLGGAGARRDRRRRPPTRRGPRSAHPHRAPGARRGRPLSVPLARSLHFPGSSLRPWAHSVDGMQWRGGGW